MILTLEDQPLELEGTVIDVFEEPDPLFERTETRGCLDTMISLFDSDVTLI